MAPQSSTYAILYSDGDKAIAVSVQDVRKVHLSISRAVTTSMDPDKYWKRTGDVVWRIDIEE